MSLVRYLLRFVAVLGPLVVLAWSVADLPASRPRQEWGLVVLVVAGFAACVFLAVVAQRAVGALVRHADLLVPLGCTVTLNGAVAALGFLPGWAPFWQGRVLGLGLALSLSLLLYILIAVLHAGWTTMLILQAIERDRVDLLAPLAHPWRWLPRTLVVLTVGQGGSFVIAAVGLAVFAVEMPVGAILIGAGSLSWNLFTAALLPGALRSWGSLVAAVGEGFSASLRGVGRWWIVVLLQMVLLGWFTFLHLSYTTTTPGGYTSQTRTNWSVNAVWTGGYDGNCRWYEQAMQIADSQTLAPIALLLELLFGFVAVAVKVTVVQRMERPAVEALEDVADEPPAYPKPWVLPAIVGIVAVGVLLAACGGLIYREPIGDALFAREFRQAVARGEDPAVLYARLDGVDGMKRAAQLSRDPDPQVRKAVIPYLIGDATAATPAQPNTTGIFVDSYSGFNTQGIPHLTALLGDPDAEVRRETIRAVTARRGAGDFGPSLRRLLDSSDATDAVLVAESLANWDVPACQQMFADRSRSKEVRLAAARGADHYGWAGRRSEYKEHLLPMLDKMRTEPDPELRHTAIAALRHTDGGPKVWLDILVHGKDETDRFVAFRSWVDTVVNDTIYPGENYPMLSATENLLFEATIPAANGFDQLDGERLAVILHVLCVGARETTAQLDKAQPANWVVAVQQRNQGGPAAQAFVEELHHLELVLRVLVAVRNFAADPRAVMTEFATQMPNEKGAGGTRKLRPFLLEEVKAPLAWCRERSGAYGSPFLRVNGRFIFADTGPDGMRPRTLGQVLKVVELDTDEALKQYLLKREKD